METREIFIGNKRDIVITCLDCGREKKVDLSHIRNTRKKVKVNCVCGSSFSAIFEKRIYYRKMSSLAGSYSTVGTHVRTDPMTVVNLSKGGLGFKTIAEPNVKEGEVLRVDFKLDTEHETPIRKSVIVRYVKDNFVGAAFCNLDENTQKSLGFYLLP